MIDLNKLQIVKIIIEQESIGFTGKIHILTKLKKEIVGTIYFLDGSIVEVNYQTFAGQKGFLKLLSKCLEREDVFKYVIEPEIISASNVKIGIIYTKMSEAIAQDLELIENSKKLRPPGSLKVLIDPNYLLKGQEISKNEFEVMKTIVLFSKIDDIFSNCILDEATVTQSLVTLRKKNALKVVA